MGIGSTCVAAINTNRDYIGIELDEKYYDISCKRIEEAINEKKQQLFK
jgi:DNA modification methylase